MEDYLEYRKAWETYPKEHIVSNVPLHLDIEITNKCNLQCDMCPYHSEKALYRPDTLEDMDFQLYRKIIDEVSKKGTKAVKLNYRGEPLLYKYLPQAIRYAKTQDIIDVRINSNGLLLTPELSTRLIYSRLDQITISDYGIIEQYRNVKKLFELRKDLGFENPLIIVQSKIDRHWQDICDNINDPIYYNYNTLEEVFENNDFECEQPFLRFMVLSDGTVMSCSCGIVIVDKIIGNVKNCTIEELWNSNKMKFLRMCNQNHETKLIRQCRMCPARNNYKGDNK